MSAVPPRRAAGWKNFNDGEIGRGDRNRTCNPRFWRPVLCQLSYSPAGRIPKISTRTASISIEGDLTEH